MQKIFTLFFFFIICLTKPGRSVAQINSTDSLALVALYNSTGGASWTNNSGWLAGPVINWNGVTTNGNSVSNVVLSNNNLIGTIPAAIGNMSNLTDLELDGNQLTGSIPTSVGNLTNLVTLVLANNQLSGTIPSSLGSLTNLSFLQLGSNQLSGSIPTSLGSLANLTYLDLSVNQLTGSIPFSLGNLVNVGTLYLNNNLLSGTIPGTLGNLAILTDLEINNNQLSGTIPDSLKTLTILNTLDISSNQLSGSIPSSLSNLVSLNVLNLYNNQLSGTIPASLGSISGLNTLNLNSNQLSGSIPSALGSISGLNVLNLGFNQLSGSIPSSIATANIYSLDLSHNQLSGTVPASFTNLTNSFTYINYNKLTFDGLEPVAPALAGALVDTPQAILPLHLNGNLLSVYAGGTLANDTFHWYKDGALIATVIGDSTYTYTIAGHYSVTIGNKIVTPESGLILYSDTLVAGIILPLRFLNFTGTLVNNNTLLQWQTATETNTSYFNVQRSSDGISFTNIGKVNAAGNSLATESYHYIDVLSPVIHQSSALVYRLQEIDNNGNSIYSNTITIELNNQGSSVSIYPNPVEDVLNINFGNNSGNALITVYDINGARLFAQSQTVLPNSTMSINATNLAKGIYLIQLSVNGSTVQQKFVKE